MKKKKWLLILIIIILLGIVLIVYNAFNGNPISKFISKTSLKGYLSENYSEDEFNLGDGFYNFKISGYSYDVRKIGEESQGTYEFNVVGLLSNEVTFDGIYQANQDRPLIEKLEQEAGLELKTSLEEIVPEVINVEVMLEVLQGKYDADTKWDKNFKAEKPMYVMVFLSGDYKSESDVVETVHVIQKKLNSEGYDYDSVSINANVLHQGEWLMKYAVGFNPDEVVKEKDIEFVNKEHFK